jgi:membrane-associated phospholipid phosphatase
LSRSRPIELILLVLALLASAGCAAGGRSAQFAQRSETLEGQESIAVKTLDLSEVDEPRILPHDDSAVELARTEDSAAFLDYVYADGYLIDLTPSPLREVCYEQSTSQSGCGASNCTNPRCRFCRRSDRCGNSCGDPQPIATCDCSMCDGSFRCGALGASESMFLHNAHQQCRAACASCTGCGQEFLAEAWLDYQDFYSLRGMAIVGAQVGAAAVLANTSLDEDFQEWHDDRIKSSGSDDFADAVSWLGDGTIMLPVVVGAAVLECFARDDQPVLRRVGRWGNRCSRSIVVGGPTVLGLQYLLGASRPVEGRGSSWKPFDDNNSVSGHAFMGATPFLNAAHMTESLPLKVTFYGLSTLPAWSRVNDQRHYLSQVLLGWGIAWLAADVVDRTERGQQKWVVVPYAAEGGMGLQSIVAF